MPSIIMLNLGKLSAYMPAYKPMSYTDLKAFGRKPRKANSYRDHRRNFQARWMRKEAKLRRQTSDESLVELQLMQSQRREFPELWSTSR